MCLQLFGPPQLILEINTPPPLILVLDEDLLEVEVFVVDVLLVHQLGEVQVNLQLIIVF